MRVVNLFKFDKIFQSNLIVVIMMTIGMHLVNFGHIKMPLFVIMCIGSIMIGATILTTASLGFWVKCLFIQSVTGLTAVLLLLAVNMTLDYLLVVVLSMVISDKISRYVLKSDCSH